MPPRFTSFSSPRDVNESEDLCNKITNRKKREKRPERVFADAASEKERNWKIIVDTLRSGVCFSAPNNCEGESRAMGPITKLKYGRSTLGVGR